MSPRKLVQWTLRLSASLSIRSVLQYNVPWLDITPFLPIYLVQYASFKDNVPPEALQFARVVRVEDRRSGLFMSTINKGRTLSTCD